jgi:glycosyltransferase involved in cell wall biosynthesis
MRAVHVVASVDDPTAGPSHSVGRLCQSLAGCETDVEIHTVRGWRAGDRASLDLPIWRHAQDFAGTPVLGALCLSSELDRTLRRLAASAQVIHSHGLWLMPNVYPAWAARNTAAAVVMSPRGMLGGPALRFSAWKKALFWRLLQGSAVASARCLHATGEAEFEEIRAFGLKGPVAIIPNGIDVPPCATRIEASATRTVLTLGRIHPKKGLANLVRAWALVAAEHPDWRLRVIGPSELGHAETLAALAAQAGLTSVSIEPAVYGSNKSEAYRQADLFVLPSLNENFAMTVAEALSMGRPVIATRGAPWAALETNGCGWWIDHGVEPLADALRLAMAMPRDALQVMGERGRAWMIRDYSWQGVAGDMAKVYQWLACGGEPPATVRVD